MEDDAIRSLVTRLARRQRDGSMVVERAAILAEGADAEAVMAWIVERGGAAEVTGETATRHGLHGSQLHPGGASRAATPARFVLPAGALD